MEKQSEESRPEETKKITNEEELSRDENTTVRKLRDYSREAKKRGGRTRDDDDDDANDYRRYKEKKSGTPITTYIAFGSLLIGLVGSYYAYRSYVEKRNEPPPPTTPPPKPKPKPNFKEF